MLSGMRAVVLGGGVVGAAVAWDLSRFAPVADVTVVDCDRARLDVLAGRLGVGTRAADLRDPATVQAVTSDADVSVGTLPSTLALPVIAQMARLGRRHVDVSFLAEDPRDGDDAARAAGAVIVYDCGVAPGLSHVLAGHAMRTIAREARLTIDVGGLPVDPLPPFYYKAPFAPADVIEEYTRPARLIRRGRTIVLPALSEPAVVDVPGVGPLEAFNTDGLRSLVDTVQARDMVERTLRYPGHLAAMRTLADAGFFDTTPLQIGSARISPREMTSALLFPQWQYGPGELDMTILRVEVSGRTADGSSRQDRWLLVDRPAAGAATSSMARTTGCPAAIVARWLADRTIAVPGVHPPERLGLDGHGDALVAALANRGITISTGW